MNSSPFCLNLVVGLIIGMLFLMATAHAASFDCGKAATEIEKLICSRDELSRLDESLDKAYLRALERIDIRKQTIESQRRWLKSERNVCKNAECIKRAYEIRISELGLSSSHGILFPRPPNRSTSSPKTLSVNEQLLRAAGNGSLEQVKSLLAQGGDVNAKREDGRTVLMQAVLSTNLELVRFLMDNGADVNAKDRSGTALLYAAGRGQFEIMKLLLDRGVDVNGQGSGGSTPLMEAAWSGNLEAVKFLINKGADVNARDERGMTNLKVFKDGTKVEATRVGRTVLMEAAWSGNLEAVKFLINKGADVNARDERGMTILKVFKDGTKVEATQVGRTVLMDAVESGNLEVVRVLIDNGADVNVRCSDGQTALSLASAANQPAIVQYLMAHGAKPSDESPHLKTQGAKPTDEPPPLPPIEERMKPPLRMKSDYFKFFPWADLTAPRKDGNDPNTSLYTMKEGDTLENVAATQMGNPNLAAGLAAYNELASSRVAPGDKIVIPSPIIGMKSEIAVKSKGQKEFTLRPFDSELKPGEDYKLRFEPNVNGYVYIVRDGLKGVELLYPAPSPAVKVEKQELSAVSDSGKVVANQVIEVPAGKTGFTYDPSQAGDRIFVFLSLRKAPDLEVLRDKRSVQREDAETVMRAVRMGEVFSEGPLHLLRITDPNEILGFSLNVND